MIVLKNERLEAHISPAGAELQKLQADGQDYLWSGNTEYWGKFSPVLFPIVGTLTDNTYTFQGRPYSLPRHGFARDMPFTTGKITQEEAVFTLEHSPETLEKYPFAFRLTLHYSLSACGIKCSYRVENLQDSAMWFSLGAHPAFKVPFHKGANYEDYFLELELPGLPLRYPLDGGFTTDNTAPIEKAYTEEGKVIIPLNHALFANDAVILKQEVKRVSIQCLSQPGAVDMCMENWPFLGIWAAPNAPFVCIEPWCGITDKKGHNLDITQKEGINSLEPGEIFERNWQVDIIC